MRQGRTILAIAFSVLAAWSAWAAGPASPSVLVIGWDGCERSRLHEMLARGELPSLRALTARGALVDITVTSGATETKAGWTQILTGYRPEVTGVFSNRVYAPIPPGLSIFERVEAAAGAGVFTAMIAAKERNLDADPPWTLPWEEWRERARRQGCDASPEECLAQRGGQAIVVAGRRLARFPGKPYFHTQFGMDVFANGLGAGRAVTDLAVATLEAVAGGRFLVFVQLARPDRDGHGFGLRSDRYEDGLREDDCLTGELLAALERLGVASSTLVYVVGDHGFGAAGLGHSHAPDTFCATNDPAVPREGDRADIAPTVLERMGIELATLRPPLDGTPLDEPRRPPTAEAPDRRARPQGR